MGLKRCFAVLAGQNGLAGADVVFKLRRLSRARDGAAALDIVVAGETLAGEGALSEGLSRLRQEGAERVLISSLADQARLLQPMPAEVFDLGHALRDHLERRAGSAGRLGILAVEPAIYDYLSERLDPKRWTLVFPSRAASLASLLTREDALLSDAAIELLAQACQDLRAQGAEIIVPGHAAFSLAVDALGARGQALVDLNLLYARYALENGAAPRTRPRKLGVVGGVGPAATVDFLDKIVRSTRASRDQEHVKVVVEMNPQIPDRTAHLIGAGGDPTGEIFSTCRQLELDAADFVAIPCNTAHAFVARIQPYLSIPVVNMLAETVAYIRERYPQCRRVGLLATDGTLASRVYHGFIEAAGLDVVAPDPAHQALVMRAIYGEQGAKAGVTTGICRDELLSALAHLADQGAEVVLLGCTELPLILAMDESFPVGARRIALLDPTTLLARRCVALAQA